MGADITATQRMLPVESGNGYSQQAKTITVNGRVYTYADGQTYDVPPQDVDVLSANGWFQVGGPLCVGVGATTARPTTGLFPGASYVDTTLGYIVVFDGRDEWRNPVTGAAV